MKHFDRGAFETEFLSQCLGRSECAPEFRLSDVTDGNIQQEPGLVLFAQVSCNQTDETLKSKNLVGMAMACIGLLMVVHFKASINRLKSHCLIDKASMPLLSTVEDYSVKCMIPVPTFDYFRKVHKETPEGPSHLLAFKRMLESQIKKELAESDDKISDQIVDITFGFGNHRILWLLQVRAVELKNGNFD